MLAGITLVANGVFLNYPFEICIRNMLACCDIVYVNTDIGNQDNTLERLRRLNKKYDGRLIILETQWNWNVTQGKDLAYRANQCLDEALRDRCEDVLYLQADEIIHPQDIKQLRANNVVGYYNVALQRLYFWQDLYHVNLTWTMPLPRLCRLTPNLRVVGDGMSMQVDHKAGTYLTLSGEIARIFHYSRVGNTRLIAQRLNKLDSLFHESDEYSPLDDYEFGKNNNFESGVPDADIVTINVVHPPGVKGFYGG